MVKSIRSFTIISTAFALILCLSTALWGGTTGKIAGRVTDVATGEPLAGANVMIVGTTLGAAADAEGDYFIINIPPGTYEVTFSMIGYQAVTRPEVIVRIDHTTPVDFGLSSIVLEAEAVTVTAEREIVKMDESASVFHASAEEIVAIPLVTDISEFIELQAGIEGEIIRGGGLDETGFMVDGLMMVDNRINEPMMMVNLSAIKEVSIIKGGFQAEYGNIRSGLINIVTRDGDPTAYHASVDIRYAPAHRRHRGPSIFSHDNYWVRSYLDPAVCYVGTENGTWSEEKQEENQKFGGWNALADKTPDRDAEQCRDMFIWQYGLHGADAVAEKYGYSGPSHERTYGDKPDLNTDISLSGPIPIIGPILGDMTFFLSLRNNTEMFAFPFVRDKYVESNYSLKLTSRLSPRMKLSVEGLYGEINSMAQGSWYSGDYMKGGPDMLGYGDPKTCNTLYTPDIFTPWDVFRSMLGLSFDHALSPSTFYNVRVSWTRSANKATLGQITWRDTTSLFQIGNTWVDETPFGYYFAEWPWQVDVIGGAQMRSGARNKSDTKTLNVKFDLTSQVNKYHQIKAGFLYNVDDIYNYNGYEALWTPGDDWQTDWEHSPRRMGAYIQDKLEFEGMVANFGLRWDYNDPNCDWFTVDPYSVYYTLFWADQFTELAPTEPAEGHSKISPRLGISHPISERTKLFFNYGHFYSMPQSNDMYRISYSMRRGVSQIGNPSADLPKTVAYELGFETNLANFLIRLNGYYKDVSDQTNEVSYTSLDELVDYDTYMNNNYADQRGFELQIDKRFGRWITGWFNYNYQINSYGTFGRDHFYQDPRKERTTGLRDPAQNKPLSRPLARANVTVRSPADYGPIFGGIGVSLRTYWKAGSWVRNDPIDILEAPVLDEPFRRKDRWEFDLRAQKRISFGGGVSASLFLDVHNVFDIKYLDTDGFATDTDEKNYWRSLKLPLWDLEEYQAEGLEAGDDEFGDIKSEDKPYINMPDRDHLTFQNPRSIVIGMTFNF